MFYIRYFTNNVVGADHKNALRFTVIMFPIDVAEVLAACVLCSSYIRRPCTNCFVREWQRSDEDWCFVSLEQSHCRWFKLKIVFSTFLCPNFFGFAESRSVICKEKKKGYTILKIKYLLQKYNMYIYYIPKRKVNKEKREKSKNHVAKKT